MTDINEENKDLIENTTPFGLLDKETQERMRAWEHGWKVWNQSENFADGWTDVSFSSQFAANFGYVFRAKLAREPEPEPSEVVHEVSITVESPLLTKEMHFKLSFDAELKNPTIEEIQ
jgi:hypothetical protein